jgi:hypothetical protein
MLNAPTEAELLRLPRLYATENVPVRDKIIYEHFAFPLSGCSWYVAEYDPRGMLFFGYAILGDDFWNAEWGYIDYEELRDLRVHGLQVERDLDWTPRKASDIERIVQCWKAQGRG